ncbi:MAG: peptidylprolyl isomerase [Candidatus Competibacteraceae bacterium]|nr:MAG: peptidylprolyl isomerase [Candidatus Competibacteraceae bacterium]
MDADANLDSASAFFLVKAAKRASDFAISVKSLPVSFFMMNVLIRFISAAILVIVAMTVRAEQTMLGGLLPPETPLIKDSELTITVVDYQKALLGLPPKQRAGIEHDLTTLQEFLLELYIEKRLVREAERLKMPDQPDIQARLQMVQRKVLVNAVVDQFKAGLKQPDFTELAQEYYQTHHKEFTRPEQLEVAHILINAPLCDCEDPNGEKRKRAEALLTELRGGADFGELARKNSDDKTSARQGGILPKLLTRGSLVKPFEDAAFALQPGELSGVVETQYGYHIIKLISRQPETVPPFEQVKVRIIEKLAKDFQDTNHKEYVARFYPKPEAFNLGMINALTGGAAGAPSVLDNAPPPPPPAR